MSTTIALFGELTFDTKQMEFEACCTSRKSIEKVKAECPIVDPDNFDWSTVDIDTWFMCFEEKNCNCYYFPIRESENRDNDYARVKVGMSHFISKGWLAYKIQ